MAVDPMSLGLAAGLSMIQYAEQKKAAEYANKFQQAVYAANVQGLHSGYLRNVERIHAEQRRSALENSVQLRENARAALQAMGLSQVASAGRGVGGRSQRESRRDIARQEAQNRLALNQRQDLDTAAAARSLEVAALNTNAQILQAFPTEVQDPSLLNTLISGVNFGANLGAFG